MSRTKKTGVKTRGGRVAVIGALGLASVALAAGPAFAKGSVDITAPRTARVGQTITVKRTAAMTAPATCISCAWGRRASAKGGTRRIAAPLSGATRRSLHTARPRAAAIGIPCGAVRPDQPARPESRALAGL